MKKSSVNKKFWILSFSLLLFLIINFILISAQIEPITGGETNFEVWGRNVAQAASSAFKEVKLDPANFTTILLGLLLWMVLYSVVSKVGLFKDLRPQFLWTGGIALIITILSFIFLPKEFVEAIAIPYAATGATILTLIPFIIVVYFTVWVTDSIVLARTIWIVFLLYYISLFVYNIGVAPAEKGILTIRDAPYIAAFIVGMMIFISLRKVRLWVFESKIEEAEERGGRVVRKAGAGARILGRAVDEFSQGGGI